MYSLIETAKLNDVDPEAYLRDVLGRIAELLPWNWQPAELAAQTAYRPFAEPLTARIIKRYILSSGCPITETAEAFGEKSGSIVNLVRYRT